MTAPAPWFAWSVVLVLVADLGACAATYGSHAAPSDSAPVSATVPAPTPDSQTASLEPIVPAPVEAPKAPAPPVAAIKQLPSVAAVKQLPPCIPVRSEPHRRRRHRPKEAQGPEPPRPKQTGADTVVDAQVGQLGAPVTSILGKDVTGPKGEVLGRVVDVLADAEGRVRVAIIDFGGFLGVGTRRIAVDWPLLRFNPNARDKSLILNVTREKLQSAPEYKDSTSPRVLVPPPAAASHDAADTGETKK